MIRAIPFALLPGAALAHGGPHLHPHGSDAFWLVLIAVIVGAGILADRLRR